LGNLNIFNTKLYLISFEFCKCKKSEFHPEILMKALLESKPSGVIPGFALLDLCRRVRKDETSDKKGRIFLHHRCLFFQLVCSFA